jgi:calcineurin-like phosphoesterase family protein
MNEHVISAHNRVVRPHDTVFYLGDLSFGKVEETLAAVLRMNGVKHWVLGNHDEQYTKAKAAPLLDQFATVAGLLDVKLGTQRVTLCHYPMLTWNRAHYGSWMLHGHSHGNCVYPYPGNRIMDVGVDTRPDFSPWSLEEVAEIMSTRSYTAADHHTEKQ